MYYTVCQIDCNWFRLKRNWMCQHNQVPCRMILHPITLNW